MNRLDTLAIADQWMNRLHPLVKFMLTMIYISVVVSFPKHNFIGLFPMFCYPMAIFYLADLSLLECFLRMKMVFPLLLAVGIFNPILERTPIPFFEFMVPAGFISMITMMLKGIFAILASYAFIATTKIEALCYALRVIHVPQLVVTQILFMYRYIRVLLEELNKMMQAYELRAPKQKGISFRAWGSLVGQLLLRSIDRAEAIYESMQLRGYQGDISNQSRKVLFETKDLLYFFFWFIVFIILRKIPVVLFLGDLFLPGYL